MQENFDLQTQGEGQFYVHQIEGVEFINDPPRTACTSVQIYNCGYSLDRSVEFRGTIEI